MSNFLALPEFNVVDGRMAVASQKQVVIRRGPNNLTIQRQTSSSLSNNQIVFNVVLGNSATTLVDPYMVVETNVNVTISATGMTGTVQNYLNNNFALRAYPFNSVIATCAVQINNQTTSSYPAQFVHEQAQFQDYANGNNQAIGQSITPIMPDQSPTYSLLQGSIKSPLNSYAAGGELYQEPRGAYNANFQTTSSGTGSWVFNVVLREPIMNPVLKYNVQGQREGLAYLKNFNVTLTLLSNISRMFSLDAVTCPNITSIVPNITSSTLVMSWLTVPDTLRLPEVALRSFNTIVTNQTNQVVFSPGQQALVNSQTYSVNQIPKYIWVYVKDAAYDIATGYNKADFTFSIQAVTVLFNNKSGLMSTFDASDLYNACQAEEGSRISYTQSQNYVGSVLALDPVKLFGLSSSESSGVLGQYNLQIQVQCTNISSQSVTPNLWVNFALDTVLTTDMTGNSNLIQGIINQSDVLSANNLPAVPGPFSGSNDIYGGNFIDTIKDYANRAFNFIKQNKLISRGIPTVVGALAPQFLPIAQPFANLANELGVGRTSRRAMNAYRQALTY